MSHLFGVADAVRIPLPDTSVDLVIGSPPYCDARTYGIGAQRDAIEWVTWMLRVTEEALRVTKGLVVWVCAGVTRDRCYWPACEGLLWEVFQRGWLMECPVFWRRVGIPGSGGDQWFRKDVEYCLAIKRVEVLPWSDNTAMGKAPKCKPGGPMSNRLANGCRSPFTTINNHGKNGRKSASQTRVEQYQNPERANPGNLLDTGVAGGGNMGHPIAHENEAPFPEAVPEFFVRSFCPPGGLVLDPFSGSGTSVSVAAQHGRRGIGLDLRLSQARLGIQRLERPHAPVIKASRPEKPMPLFGA